jgi:multimeric flavodoxin WrbA
MAAMKAIIILGSRNPAGQTARAADGLIEGLSAAGSEAEKAFLPVLRIERCRQCTESGWGTCKSEGRCVITEDDFAGTVGRIRAADLAVFATPVYFGDLSESMRAFLDRLRRIARHDAGKAGIAGKPAVGICVAGGGGGGAPFCGFQLDKILNTIGFDLFDTILARRQNLDMKRHLFKAEGEWVGRNGAPKT